jgi:transposase
MNATTTTHATAAAGTILALDLGKYKSVACCYDRGTAQGRFHTLDTSYANLRRLFEQQQPTLVVVEACALAGWVHDLCAELGLPCKVANTASEAWKYKHTKRKTDKDDALRLAQLEALGQLPTVVVPPKQTRQWRALIAGRQDLIGRRVAVQNRIRALLVTQGLPAPRGHRAWTAAGLKALTPHALPLADCDADQLWRGLLDLALTEYRHLLVLLKQVETRLDAMAEADANVRLLESIPGVGSRTAEVVVAYLGEAGRFHTAKQVGAYGGLVPRQYQSGDSDRRGRITRRGPALLRKMLVECAWVMLRYNRWARVVYQRLSRGKARKKQAIVAVARRLLIRCWAMLRDQTRWRDETATASPPALPA